MFPPLPRGASIRLFVVESEATRGLDRVVELASIAELSTVADGPALARQLEAHGPGAVVVCDWSSSLARWIEKAPHPPRVIHIGARVPQGMLEAIGHGLDIAHADGAEAVVALLSPTRAKRRGARRRPGRLVVRAAGLAGAHVVVDLSTRGLAFEVDAASPHEPALRGTVLLDLEIRRGTQVILTCAEATVVHASATDHGTYRIGCELTDAARPHAVAQRRVLRDAVKTAGLVVRALKTASLVLRGPDDELLLHGASGTLDAERGDVTLPAPKTALRPHDVVHGSFELAGALHRFAASVISHVPFRITVPTELEETRRRGTARHAVGDDAALVVEIASPLADAPVRRPLVDVSSGGLSFALDADTDVLPVGLRLSSVAFTVGGSTFRGSGVVRHVGRGRHGARPRCGVELDGLCEADRAHLAERIVAAQFPGLEDGGRVAFDDLMGFFRAAGYLDAERDATLAPMMPTVRATFAALSDGPNRLVRSLVYKDAGRVVGHISSARSYRRTFMVQHLAAAAGRNTGHAGLFLSVGNAEYLMQTPDFDFLKIWFHAQNKFPARVFGGFARKVRDPEECVLEAFAHFTLPSADDGALAAGDVEIHEATDADLARVERHFVKTRAPLIVRSDDLLRSALTLSSLDAKYREIGLERRRIVLVATRGHEHLGFALVEISSPGLNLFEALSRFSVHLLPAGERDAPTTRRALLAEIRATYRRAGRAAASALVPRDEARAYEALGFTIDADESMCLTTRRSQLRRFSEHMTAMTVPRQPKRAPARADASADEEDVA